MWLAVLGSVEYVNVLVVMCAWSAGLHGTVLSGFRVAV